MNYEALAALLAQAPYATMADAEAAAALNTPSVTVTRETMISERGLYARLGPVMAEEILQRLDLAAPSNAVIARVRSWLAPAAGGIDLGLDATRAQIDVLVAATVLTAEQGAAIKALGEYLVSPAEAAGLGRVELGHVQHARGRN